MLSCSLLAFHYLSLVQQHWLLRLLPLAPFVVVDVVVASSPLNRSVEEMGCRPPSPPCCGCCSCCCCSLRLGSAGFQLKGEKKEPFLESNDKQLIFVA